MSLLLRRGVLSSGISDGEIFSANTSLLNGTTQYFDAGDPIEFNSITEISLSAWVYIDSTASTRVILSKWLGTGNQRSWQLIFNSSSNKFEFFITSTGSSPASVVGTTTVSSSTIYHVAATSDGTDIKIYINGSEEASAAYTAGIFDSTASLLCGAQNAGTSAFWDGSLSFPMVFDESLTPSEITLLNNSGTALCFNGMSTAMKNKCIYAPRLANWNANSGDELIDQSSSGITTSNIASTPFTGSGVNVEC